MQSLEEDNNIHRDLTLVSYAKLKFAFERQHGTFTTANSTPMTDGAAAVMLTFESHAKSLGITPLGYIRSYAFSAIDVW